MKNIERLYGVKKATWLSMPYVDALNEKIRLANEVISMLHSQSYMVRDSSRVTDCVNAIRFNEKLIKE